jgi:hypothetical protein
MFDLLTWIYLVNATLLIVHEIDSAYWKEWELFKLPGGAGGFVILHKVKIILSNNNVILRTPMKSGDVRISQEGYFEYANC